MSKLAIGLAIFLVLHGCKYDCQKNHITPVFIGFSHSDIDTVVLRAFKPNDNFQHLVDTFLYNDKYATIYTVSGDSTFVYLNDSDPSHWISAGFDWQIYLPGKKKTIIVTNILSPDKEGSKNCLNPIESFEQDGQFVKPIPMNTGQFYTSGYLLYIHS